MSKRSNAGDDGERTHKKARVDDAPQPRNMVLPTSIVIAKKPPASLRIAAWNVCGLASSMRKGFKYYLQAEDPDVLVLTETRVNNPPLDPLLTTRFPHRYWSIAAKSSYSGTAILSKLKPLSVEYGLPGHPNAESVKGRVVTLEFAGCFLVGTYAVNAGEKLKTLEAKEVFMRALTAHLRALDTRKPVIWTGDLNCAPTALDLANAPNHWNKSAGYTTSECAAFAAILDGPTTAVHASSQAPSSLQDPPPSGRFVDVWRRLHPALEHYTYFNYRFEARRKGHGWRIDMCACTTGARYSACSCAAVVLSERIADAVAGCEIRGEIWGASDHCPVVLDMPERVLLEPPETPTNV